MISTFDLLHLPLFCPALFANPAFLQQDSR